jgi:peptidoglycan/LPS O-acetylase OafA/YrhL
VPLDFSNHWKRLAEVGMCQLDPPAWSLGLELTFYVFAPAILFFPRLARLAGLVSIAIFLYAWLGYINLFVFGYTLLPGTLFIFLLGASVANAELVHKKLPLIIWLSAVCMLLALQVFPKLRAIHLSFEILVGLIIGIPALALLSKIEKPDDDSRWTMVFRLDERLGNYSYGVFLNHYLLTWLVLVCGSLPIAHLPAFTLASLLLSAASFHVIEAPVLRRRRAVRYRNTSSAASIARSGSPDPNLVVGTAKANKTNTFNVLASDFFARS